MIDCVLSYHADTISCGVSRFSQQLAKRLGVPFGTVMGGDEIVPCEHPLVSLKLAELRSGYIRDIPLPPRYDLFLHDYEPTRMLKQAGRVFAASSAVAQEIRSERPDVIAAWCPSLVEAQPREPVTVFSLGMAHKFRTELYATLKEKLDATGEPYVVYVSAALHDGTSFSDASRSFGVLRTLFGHNFVFLGTLSDEAMVDRLRTCTYVAAFFEKGLRENNTSVMAAIDYGATVLTNWDAQTPSMLMSLTHQVGEGLPHIWQRQRLRIDYGWDRLVELIRHV